MDICKQLYDLKSGFTSTRKYNYKLGYKFQSLVFEERMESIQNPLQTRTYDFDVVDNWLVASHSNFHASIYNLSFLQGANFNYLSTWAAPQRPPAPAVSPFYARKYPFECVNWNMANKFFTVTGNSPDVYLVDTVTCTTLEQITVCGATRIYQHKPHPQNKTSIAIASNLKAVPLLDVRTGNVSFTVKKHVNKVRSVAWSPVHEFILASVSDTELILWDVRNTSRLHAIKMENVKAPGEPIRPLNANTRIIPEIQFIPGTAELVGLTADKKLYVLNCETAKLKLGGILDAEPHIRYKFSLVGFSTPPILFLPAGPDINMIEMKCFKVLNVLSGHVFDVNSTIFNPLKNELYSSSKEGNIIWGDPKHEDSDEE